MNFLFLASADNTVMIQMGLRWIHLVAGITWIGLLYFFNLVNTPFMGELNDPALKAKVFPPLMTRAMFWFRWSALLTVVAGVWYWMTIIGADVRNAHALANTVSGEQTTIFAGAKGGLAIGGFFALWTVVWAICNFCTASLKLTNLPVVLAIYALTVSAAAFTYVSLNSHGWESNRLLSIGIGGGMGWVMIFNVWGVIWRINKKMIGWMDALRANGTPLPPEAAALARQGAVVSRANFALSFPMLFFMAAASHFPAFAS